jgi:hypothetical protein
VYRIIARSYVVLESALPKHRNRSVHLVHFARLQRRITCTVCCVIRDLGYQSQFVFEYNERRWIVEGVRVGGGGWFGGLVELQVCKHSSLEVPRCVVRVLCCLLLNKCGRDLLAGSK